MHSPLPNDEMVNKFADTHLPWNLEVSKKAALQHSTKRFGEFWAVATALGGMSGQRGPKEIRRTNGEFLAVLLVHNGREIFTQKGNKSIINAGSAIIWDGVLPAECYTEGALNKSTFFLPRDLAKKALPHLDAIVGKPLISNGSLKLLSSWIKTAMTTEDLDDTAETLVGKTATDLLAAALGSSTELVLDTRAIRLMEVRSFIEQELSNPELDTDMIAAGTNFSTRYLHSLFEGSGETCRQFLQRRRLEKA